MLAFSVMRAWRRMVEMSPATLKLRRASLSSCVALGEAGFFSVFFFFPKSAIYYFVSPELLADFVSPEADFVPPTAEADSFAFAAFLTPTRGAVGGPTVASGPLTFFSATV